MDSVVEEERKVLDGPRAGEEGLNLSDLAFWWQFAPLELPHPDFSLLDDRVDARQQLGLARRVRRETPGYRLEHPAD
ncbi:hypothetical protein [Streptomyces roseus]|uniref:hypothetical protein n=1 Tax=Streptomyces roseus TaxID=66430 RepID=UPI00131CCECE|nr:hypothetical protein [Streptomyces roseus]